MLSLIRNLLGNALKTNDSLYFVVLTGCLRVSEESILTGLNNLKVHTISDVRYDEYFGFTNADVDELLEFYGLSSYKDVIRDWYDGYRFGNTDIYCPWDVINFFDELLTDPCAEPENYWVNTSGNIMECCLGFCRARGRIQRHLCPDAGKDRNCDRSEICGRWKSGKSVRRSA